MKTTEKVGVLCVYDNEKTLIAINKLDMATRKHIFYKCVEMSEEEIEGLLKCDEKNIATLRDNVKTSLSEISSDPNQIMSRQQSSGNIILKR